MKKSKLSLILIFMLVFSLVGCNSNSDKENPESPQVSAETPADGETPVDENTPAEDESDATQEKLNLYVGTEINTLIQWASSNDTSFTILNNVFEGLYRLDTDSQPQPALAKDYKVSDDGLTYTFYLKDNIKWSNGTEITANDFVFSWLKQMSNEATNGYSFIMNDYIVGGKDYFSGNISAEEVGVKAIDEKTFEVTLVQPTPYFQRLTVLPMFFPLNEEFVTSQGDNYGLSADAMIYSGPYVIEKYDIASGCELAKNDMYWDADNVAIKDINVRVIKDCGAALNAYKAGQISKVTLQSTDVPAFKDSDEFYSGSDFRTDYIQFNTTNPNMSNVKIRQALSYAIDRDVLINVILADGSGAGVGMIPFGMNGNGESTFRELNGEINTFDANKAKELWAEGVEEIGFTPELTILISDDNVVKTIATFVQSQFKSNLDIDVKIDSKTSKARNEIMDGKVPGVNYDMAITAWGADYDDAMTYLDLWTNGTPYRGNYVSDEYNSLIAQAKVENDNDVRTNLLLEAEKRLCFDDMVAAPLYYRGFAYLQKSNIENLTVHSFGPPIEFKYANFK